MSKTESLKTSVNNKTLWIALAIILFTLMVLGAIMGAWLDKGSNIETVKVERLFLDVDGDKKVDLLMKGEVIFNDGPLAQPTPKP